MSAPEKPWEVRKRNLIPHSVESQSSLTGATSSRTPPAVPPRPSSSGSSGYNASYGYGAGYYPRQYGTGFGGYNYYSYPGAGYSLGNFGSSYNGYGGYGGYRPFGFNQDREPNPLVRQAEESTRFAFQSVESVVGAVGSIAMMLESTYFAVHSCFRALLGVAEHFSNIKNHIWGVLSAIQLLRRLQYWLRRLMVFLRLRQFENSETAWDETVLSQVSNDNSTRQKAWPALMFFVVIFGIPWLMYRLITLLQSSSSPPALPNWASPGGDHIMGRALYDFHSNKTDEISFSSGDVMILAPQEHQPRVRGWLLAAKGDKVGLVPANHVDVLGRNSTIPTDRKFLNNVLEVDQTD